MKQIEIILKNFLLRILLLLVKRNDKDYVPVFNEKSNILFIRLNRIGDALVVTPLLHQIKDSLKCEISILAASSNHFIFENNPSIDHIILFNKGLGSFFETLKLIKRERYDAVVDLHDDVSTTVSFLIALCQAKNKFGLRKSNEIVYSRTVERPDPKVTHVVDRIFEIARLFNVKISKESAGICYQPEEHSVNNVKNILLRKFKDKKYLIGMNITAGSKARFWGIENFQMVLKFLSQYDVNVLIITTTKDVEKALQITSDDRDKIFYSPLFDEFAATVSCLDFLFTPDTSIIHLASAYNVPVFGLYVKYNTEDMIWSPYRTDFESMTTTNYNLTAISAEETLKKLKPFLEKHIYEFRNTKM
ncbi:MAG: glycosyltransferase family 9 protein [Ignavibacteria bacterium]